MKVAIVAPSPVPFTRGGAERAWAGLHLALLDAGHDAELIKIPVRETTLAGVVAGYRAFAELDVSHFDTVISSKYPAWLVHHRRHVVWMFHPLRGLYDTYALFGLPDAIDPTTEEAATLAGAVAGPAVRGRVPAVLGAADAAVDALGADHRDLVLPGPLSRAVVRWLDRVALDPVEVHRHVALSRTVAQRPGYFPEGVVPRIAHAPSDLRVPVEVSNTHADAGDYLFTTSRLDGPKRLDLLIRAMATVPGGMPLLIGGTGPERDRLERLAAPDPRVRFLGFVPDDELAGLYAGARAVPFIPEDEDYGLIAVEAMTFGVPVVTCSDSGGPTELVQPGRTGLVAEPDPEALGAALASLVTDPELAAGLGRAARERVARLTWPTVLKTLLGPPAAGERATAVAPHRAAAAPGWATEAARSFSRRPKVTMLTTFPVAPRRHGGQLRAFHLARALSHRSDVEIISLVEGTHARSTELAPNLIEHSVPRTSEHAHVGARLSAQVGMAVTDIVAGSSIVDTPEYLRRLAASIRGARAVVLAEPYLLPALDEVGSDRPLVYDAYNVEADLKAEALPRTDLGRRLYDQVLAVEGAAVTRADVVTACSEEDVRRLAATHGLDLSRFEVVPNGTDVAVLRVPSPTERRLSAEAWLAHWRALHPSAGEVHHLALFLASWHPPNLAAAEVLMALAPEMPEVQLVLGGSHGDAFVDRTTPDNVVFTGPVSDRAKHSLLAAADVAVNPMLKGSGTNLKVIEYFAAGVPVVSTAFGIRGVDAEADRHLLVAEPHDMVEAIRRTFADPARAAARTVAARDLAVARYDWTRIGARLAAIVARVGGRGHDTVGGRAHDTVGGPGGPVAAGGHDTVGGPGHDTVGGPGGPVAAGGPEGSGSLGPR